MIHPPDPNVDTTVYEGLYAQLCGTAKQHGADNVRTFREQLEATSRAISLEGEDDDATKTKFLFDLNMLRTFDEMLTLLYIAEIRYGAILPAEMKADIDDMVAYRELTPETYLGDEEVTP